MRQIPFHVSLSNLISRQLVHRLDFINCSRGSMLMLDWVWIHPYDIPLVNSGQRPSEVTQCTWTAGPRELGDFWWSRACHREPWVRGSRGSMLMLDWVWIHPYDIPLVNSGQRPSEVTQCTWTAGPRELGDFWWSRACHREPWVRGHGWGNQCPLFAVRLQ